MKSIFLKLTYFTSLIFISATIYIYTYWRGFDIEIFPYIAIGEIVMYGLTPLIKESLPILAGLTICLLFIDRLFPFGGYEKLQKEENKTEKKLITNFERFVRRITFVAIYILLPLGLIIVYFKSKESFYHILPIIVAPFSIFLINRLMSYDAIKDVNIDSKIVFFSVFLLISSFSTAKLDFIKVETNKEFKYIVENEDFYKFIGKGGDYFFLKALDNKQTIIHSKAQIMNLIFYKYNGEIISKNDTIINNRIAKD